MFRPLASFIGLRYLRAKQRNHFISFISFISVLSLALGIAMIITVLSVMNGFQREIKDRILSMTAHATVLELDGKLQDWQKVERKLVNHPVISGTAPYVQGQGMLVNGKKVSGVMISGIDPELEDNVSRISEYVLDAGLDALKPGEFGILLGASLADYMRVKVGEKVTVIAPEATVTPAGILPKYKRFTVVGRYSVGMPQYDRNTVAIHIEDAKRLFHLGDAVTGLRLHLDDLFNAPVITRDLRTQLGKNYWITDWTNHNRDFFRALKMEKNHDADHNDPYRFGCCVQYCFNVSDGGDREAKRYCNTANIRLHAQEYNGYFYRTGYHDWFGGYLTGGVRRYLAGS